MGLKSFAASDTGSRVGRQLNIVAITAFAIPAAAGALVTLSDSNPVWAIIGVAVGLVLAQSPRVAQQWERAVVLRLGKFTGLRGPGLFWVMPFVDSVSS